MKENKDNSDSDKNSSQESDDDESDAESDQSSAEPKQHIEPPKSYIQELSSMSDSEDEKKTFLQDTLGIIGKIEDEESKASKAIGDELDSLFKMKKKVKKPLIK